MKHFLLTPMDEAGERFWVAGNSQAEARALVALNAHPDANDPAKFSCYVDGSQMPPPGVIRRIGHAFR